MTTSRNKIHLSAKTIIRLMYRVSELIIIMGKYFGIYAKDSLDELLLTTHHSSTYRGKSREVERRAFSKWLLGENDRIKTDEVDERSSTVAKILGHMNNDGEWITTAKGQDPMIKDDVCWDSNDYNEKDLGDSFPYIKGHKPWV